MKTLLPYLIAVNLLLVLQVVYYRLFLARQRRFGWNRAYLVCGLGVALLLPFLRWEIVPQGLPDPGFLHRVPALVTGENGETVTRMAPLTTVAHSGVADTITTGAGLPMIDAVPASSPILPSSFSWNAWTLAWMAYLSISGMLLLLLLYRNAQVWLQIRRSPRTKMPDHTLVSTDYDLGPATYFRFILWRSDPAQSPQDAAVALAHERCHARQLHTLDLIAVELVRAFCWFNPAVHLLRRDLRRTHEYLADQAALTVAGPEAVRRLLLQRQLRTPHLHIVHPFYSQIKSRLKMLAHTPQKKALLGYFMILPLAAVMLAGTNSCSTVEGKDVSALDSPMTVNAQAAEANATTDSSRTSAANTGEYTPFFSIEKLYLENEMSNYANNPKSDKTVCLGEMPQTLDMSDLESNPETWPTGHPEMLNQAEVKKAIGNPNPDKKAIPVKVVAKVLVDETGHVIRYQFDEATAPAVYRDAVQAHIEELLFKPGTEKGKPAKWWVIVPFLLGNDGC